MSNELRILAVHGVGNHGADLAWQQDWIRAIERAIGQAAPGLAVQVEFCMHDDLFAAEEISVLGTLEAVAKLTGSYFTAPRKGRAAKGQPEGSLSGRARNMFEQISFVTRWTAGMVVQWVENEKLRQATRRRLVDDITRTDPQVVVAHSLGSLIAYDLFSDSAGGRQIENRAFVSLGSQIANRFVLGNFRAGRLVELPAQQWFHLFNPHDDVFTAPIRLTVGNFRQVVTQFDLFGPGDHAATEYLSHPQAVREVWHPLTWAHRSPQGIAKSFRETRQWYDRERTKPQQRALLVGINEYANPSANLDGCVNDVYLFSEILQEAGFDAADMRIVLNERATADAIRERLEWLVGGAGPNDQLVFYYSGHGAQLPTYNEIEVVDRMLECLVPHDFDWTEERAITDKQIYQLYSQLPYDTQFLMVFDCCHSGGMHRSGARRAKGIDPPDDVRFRMLRWDGNWQQRALPPLIMAGKPTSGAAKGAAPDEARYFGGKGSLEKLGGAAELRRLAPTAAARLKEQQDHRGPFMPIIYQACQEHELAYEHRVGATAYGAFTYHLVQQLREWPKVTFEALCTKTADALRQFNYQQTPVARGPSQLLTQPVPWPVPGGRPAKQPTTGRGHRSTQRKK